jgi:archaellum component FlaC
MSNYEKISSIIETMTQSNVSIGCEILNLNKQIAAKEELLVKIQEEINEFKKTLDEHTEKRIGLKNMMEETKKGFKQIQEATDNLYSIIDTKYQ